MIWSRYRSQMLWILGFVVVVSAALAVTAPTQPEVQRPVSTTSAPTGCPPAAPNAAAGCLLVTSH